METAATDPQVLVLAMRLKGEVTWAPLAGVVTVMADAGTLIPKRTEAAKRSVFINKPRVTGEHALIRVIAARSANADVNSTETGKLSQI
jgi:hypothetical protein